MKQTAVEWLIEKHFGGIDNCTPDFRYHINKAKEMEKQQIIDFAESYSLNCMTCSYDGEAIPLKDSATFYNETFKQL